MKPYGKELILDLHKCNVEMFTRESIEHYCKILCGKIDMVRGPLHFWDYQCEECGHFDKEDYDKAEDHVKGISAIQFISTSSIVIHTLDVLKNAYINIFSCKLFDPNVATNYSKNFFQGEVVGWEFRDRV